MTQGPDVLSVHGPPQLTASVKLPSRRGPSIPSLTSIHTQCCEYLFRSCQQWSGWPSVYILTSMLVLSIWLICVWTQNVDTTRCQRHDSWRSDNESILILPSWNTAEETVCHLQDYIIKDHSFILSFHFLALGFLALDKVSCFAESHVLRNGNIQPTAITETWSADNNHMHYLRSESYSQIAPWDDVNSILPCPHQLDLMTDSEIVSS